MKPDELKHQFIILRAENYSLSSTANKLDISKSTAQRWEEELKNQIKELRSENIKELYHTYEMTREARIKSLGENLSAVNSALSSVDMKQLPPEKLLDYKLKLIQALKREYVSVSEPVEEKASDISPAYIMSKYATLLERVEAGEITTAQAEKENSILFNLLKAYETKELQEKVEALEDLLKVRN